MKTALFAPLYLDGKDKSGSYRSIRNARYLSWYKANKDLIGFDDIWMLDNGSNKRELERLSDYHPGVTIVKAAHLPTGQGDDYPYCWRAIWFMKTLILLGYEKILFIDSDAFVVSERLAKFTKDCNTGWQTLFCKRYNFPAAEFQILCKDAFDHFESFTSKDYMEFNGKKMEEVLPFTHVNQQFDCDRYGEDNIAQHHNVDLYSQAPTHLNLKMIYD